MESDVGRLVAQMDEANVQTLVNLDGRWGRELEDNLDRYDRARPGRFLTFCHVDWRLLSEAGGPERLAVSLRASVRSGARGLKVWKDLGLSVRVGGKRVLPDDPMLYPLWEEAADAGIPVLIHVADPLAFFLPADRYNERIEQMRRYPRGTRHPGGQAAHHLLIDSFERLVDSHPRTTFVAAHACFPENLERVDSMLRAHPNLHIDVAAVASELGRQPRATRAVLVRHPDRVLFGTDVFPLRPAAWQIYIRLLETADENFDYSDEEVPPWGRWRIYGLDLPPDVLEAVYRDNAARLLGLGGVPHSATGRHAMAAPT